MNFLGMGIFFEIERHLTIILLRNLPFFSLAKKNSKSSIESICKSFVVAVVDYTQKQIKQKNNEKDLLFNFG